MDNQQRLLDCALELFCQRGYDAVGVQEIVDTAGVTKPTLYHYFNSKRGLLDALLIREAGHLLHTISQSADYQGDLVRTLEEVTHAYFEIAENSEKFYRMQLAFNFAPMESAANQAVRAFAREQHDILESVFVKAAQDHGNLRGREKRYAVGFLGAVNAVIGLYLNGKLELNGEIVYQTVHQFMYGIFS